MSNSKFINLAISRAQKISNRAGIGWVLLDKDKQLVRYDACMAGLDSGNLEHCIRTHQHEADELYLSIEPTSNIFRLETLLQTIESSNLTTITIGKHFEDSVPNHTWSTWVEQWQGTVTHFPSNPIVENLSLGIQTLRSAQRPWFTCITASDLSGNNQQLTQLINEFDFLNNISNLVRQSRAILISPTQRELLEHLPTQNFANEPLDPFEVDDEIFVSAVLRHLAQDYRFNAVLLGDTQVLSRLIALDMVDEVIHHFVNTKSDTLEPARNTASPALHLEGMQITDSTVVGNCSRVVFRKRTTTERVKSLGCRLN